MKIAIPVFHTKVSPRFDQTQGFVLLETESDKVVTRQNLSTKGWSVFEKMKQLLALGVDTLICGGIDRTSIQYLSDKGVNVYSWVTGEVNDAVICFLNDKMEPGIILGSHGRMKGRWQFCQGRNHFSNRFHAGWRNGEKEVRTMPRGDGQGPQGKGPRSGKGRGGCNPRKQTSGKGKGQGQRAGRGQGRGKARQSGDDT
jgi:predicted Fe-Mo cluster-binding NifX family protein